VDAAAPAATAALAGMREAYGVEPVVTGVGGSIPFVAELVRSFPAAQILITGVEDPASRAHSPDESLHLETFRKAVLAEALLLESLQRNGLGGGPAA
jgi:acetylornithine deacetylase/succinyl-diaminopimelate desuccinylase-like protein